LTRHRDCQFRIGLGTIELHLAQLFVAIFGELVRLSDPFFGQTQLEIGLGHAL